MALGQTIVLRMDKRLRLWVLGLALLVSAVVVQFVQLNDALELVAIGVFVVLATAFWISLKKSLNKD